MAELHEYRVGQLYSPGRTSWPTVVEYNYRAGAHELRAFLPHPSAREVRSFTRRDAEFALYVEQPLILLLYRFFPAMPDWSDAPFSIHLVPEAERQLPEPAGTSEPHALLAVILVDAATGLIAGLRALTLPPAFTAALHLAIRDQAALPWDAAAYDDALNRLYTANTSAQLAARAQARFLSSPQPWRT